MDLNHTTSFISTPHVEPDFPRYYTLIPLVVLTLSGCIVAVVFYVKRKSRLDELRHHLIPLYTYDPTEEQEDWRDYDKEDEEEELAEPLYKDSRLSFASDDGT